MARGGSPRARLVAPVLALAVGLAVLPRPALADEPSEAEAARPNPLAGDPAAIRRGQGLFLQNCAPCHGAQADGRGPGAVGLRPPPADLAGPDVVPKHPDGWVFWRISNGKRGTAMPPFAFSLSEPERWSIVAWLRSLRGDGPSAPDAPKGQGAALPLVTAH